MRKRYLSFLLSLIIFLTSFTPAFADSVEVLEPIMSGVESSEEKDNHSSDSVFVLDSRDKNNKVVEDKKNSGSISTPNILEERDNKVGDNLNPYLAPKKAENIKDIVNPVTPQIKELTEREKAPAVKDAVNEKEAVNEGLEASNPMGGGKRSCYWS